MFHVEQIPILLAAAASFSLAAPVDYGITFQDDEDAEPVEEVVEIPADSAVEPTPTADPQEAAETPPTPVVEPEPTVEPEEAPKAAEEPAEPAESTPEEATPKEEVKPAEEPPAPPVEPTPIPEGEVTLSYPALNLPLATASPGVAQSVEAGMIDLLLGWEESARRHFIAAIAAGVEPDAESMLAHCGVIIAVPDARLKEENRAELEEKIDTIPATPVEQFYLSTFLKLISREHVGAAQDFAERAKRYRGDAFSAAWAIMLLHCADIGYDINGRVNHYQQQALELAHQAYAEHPQNPLICYVRAYIEESAPQVSQEALEAASEALKQLPGHPMPYLLMGHLLYRSERAAEAVPYFRKAAELASVPEIEPGQERLKMTALLYESTALWSSYQDEEALASRRAMNAEKIDAGMQGSPLMVLRRWEANTLPLRILIRREEAPSVVEIRAAVKAATPSPALPGEDAVLVVRDCLRAALYARARMKTGDSNNAQKSLVLAQQKLEEFDDTQESVFAQGAEFITPWYRALEACKLAILIAGSEVYPDPDEFWKKVAGGAMRPGTMLLPPPVPERCGEKPSSASTDTSKKAASAPREHADKAIETRKKGK